MLDWLAQPATVSFIFFLFHFTYVTPVYPKFHSVLKPCGGTKYTGV
jgi:hypothetical protein